MSSVQLIGSIDAIHVQQYPEGDRVHFRNVMLDGGSKNNGCTEKEIQYNHYDSEALGDEFGCCQPSSFRLVFQF
jgi:hypothetical protein